MLLSQALTAQGISKILTSEKKSDIFLNKTQIALEFIYKYKEKASSTSIFWIYAGNATTFWQSYSEVAERLDLPNRKDTNANILQIVEKHFSHEHCGPWLLVVDNADDQALFFDSQPLDGTQLFTHLPRNAKGSIIFTLRGLKSAFNLTDSACGSQLTR